MEKILLIILICIIVALIAYRGVNKNREKEQMQVPINNKNEKNIDEINNKNEVNIDDRIGKLILEKRMFGAVKEYRMATGASLMEAKNHVDALAEAIKEGKKVDVDEQPEVKNNELDEQLEVKNAELDERLRKLLSDGQKVAAVKVCRDETGYDLLEAKRYVESLE